MIQSGAVDYQSVHFSDRFAVVKTACDTRGLSSQRWRYVSCLGCLDVAPDDPRIRERKQTILEERIRLPTNPVGPFPILISGQ